MSRKSEQVKEWRRRTKERLVKAFGGVCCVCNRKLDNVVYDFHHIDGKKEDQISNISRGNIKAWGKIVAEARKCVMVCSNCHRLVHADVAKIPEDALRFDERYAYYDPVVYPKLRTGDGKKVYHLLIRKYIKKPEQIASKRPPKNILKVLLKKNSVMALSRQFGVSHTTIRRWSKKYKLVK